MGIGKNIKTITKNKGITLLELSKKSGVPINTIYTLTSEDPEKATPRTINRLAAALGVDSNMLRMDPEEYKEYEKQELIFLLGIDPEKYDIYTEEIKKLVRQHENEPNKPDKQYLSVALPEGVYLVEDHEVYPGCYGYSKLIQIVYPEGTIDITQEEMDDLKKNIERYAAFTLESFKHDHEDRLIENEKDDPTK